MVTHSFVRDIPLPSGKTLALHDARQRTRSHAAEHPRPGHADRARRDARRAQGRAAQRRRSTASAVTGKQFILAAGADLIEGRRDPDHETARG